MLVDHQLVEATITYPETRARVTCTFPLFFAGKMLVNVPCDLFHGIENYSPFIGKSLLTLAETAAFLATQPDQYEGV